MKALLAALALLLQPSPVPASGTHFVCCYDGVCEPSEGRCADGWVLHECSDEEVCNDDGTACWNECWIPSA